MIINIYMKDKIINLNYYGNRNNKAVMTEINDILNNSKFICFNDGFSEKITINTNEIIRIE